MRVPCLSAKQGWAIIAGFVLYHDLACNDGELLSEGVDRGLESKHRILVYTVVASTAAHLLNLLPTKLDPFYWIWKITKKGNR